MNLGSSGIPAVLSAFLCLLILSACEQLTGAGPSQPGEQQTASQLLTGPEEGPQLFGPWENGDQSLQRSRDGNSARVARSGGSSTQIRRIPTRPAAGNPAPSAPAPQIAAAPPPQQPQPLSASSNVPAFEQGYIETPSGLKYIQTRPGQGPTPNRGDTIVAHYQGWIYENGAKGDLFDRSSDRPFTFELGAGQVIQGWDEAFGDMRPGEKRTLIIPSELAYGRTGAPGLIRPNEDLIFDVELVEIQ